MKNVLSSHGLALENVFLIFASGNCLLTQKHHFLRSKIVTEFGEISATSFLLGVSQKVEYLEFLDLLQCLHTLFVVFLFKNNESIILDCF